MVSTLRLQAPKRVSAAFSMSQGTASGTKLAQLYTCTATCAYSSRSPRNSSPFSRSKLPDWSLVFDDKGSPKNHTKAFGAGLAGLANAGVVPITGGGEVGRGLGADAHMPVSGQKVLVQVLHFVPTGVVCSVSANLDPHAPRAAQQVTYRGLISNHELTSYRETTGHRLGQ